MKIYLAGPIQGQTDLECIGWRNAAKHHLEQHGHSVSNPMDRDFRGSEESHAEEIVEGDKDAIAQSDLLLVKADFPSWGTAMEIAYAKTFGKDVVAFSDADVISPWLRCHTTAIYNTLHDALLGITTHSMKGLR